jgi:2-oxoglutarate ferredoxin oxidoreductase subunit gamma
MKTELIIAGFGGQGVLFAGKVLAYAAMLAGLEVTWLPSYGPQMRGGTANCTVVISTQPIRSPLVRNPANGIVLNRPSLTTFEPALSGGGVLVINETLIKQDASRKDIRAIKIRATGLAEGLGNIRLANIVALGAFVGATHVVEEMHIIAALNKLILESRAELRVLNERAFQAGYASVTNEAL